MDNGENIVIREKVIKEAKYRRIIENTVRDTNRVYAIWKASDKKRLTLENFQCVFRSNLSKYFWEEFPNNRRKSVVGKYSPTCHIVDNEIVGIGFYGVSMYRHYGYSEVFLALEEFASNFDYQLFNAKNRCVITVKETIKEVDSLREISFDSITSIKF